MIIKKVSEIIGMEEFENTHTGDEKNDKKRSAELTNLLVQSAENNFDWRIDGYVGALADNHFIKNFGENSAKELLGSLGIFLTQFSDADLEKCERARNFRKPFQPKTLYKPVM